MELVVLEGEVVAEVGNLLQGEEEEQLHQEHKMLGLKTLVPVGLGFLPVEVLM